MRNVTLALIALVTLFAAACGGAADTPPEATPTLDASATGTPARSVADVVTDSESQPAPTASDSAPSSDGGSVASPSNTGREDTASRPTRLKLETPERQVLVQAIQTIEALRAYEFEWSMTLASIEGVPGGVTFSGGGAVDPTRERVAMTVDFTDLLGVIASADDLSAEDQALMQSFFGDEPLEIRYVDGTAYLSWPIFSLFLGTTTKWVAFDDPTGGEAFGAIPGGIGGANPLDATAFLEEVWGIEEVGRETLRGVETTRYAGLIDVSEVMDALGPDELAELEAALDGQTVSDFFGEFPVNVWIGDDGVMRRFTITVDFSGFGEAGATAEALIGSIEMSYEFFNIGGDIQIIAPPADEVTNVSDSDFLSGLDFAG
jgi:hypothetical protein